MAGEPPSSVFVVPKHRAELIRAARTRDRKVREAQKAASDANHDFNALVDRLLDEHYPDLPYAMTEIDLTTGEIKRRAPPPSPSPPAPPPAPPPEAVRRPARPPARAP